MQSRQTLELRQRQHLAMTPELQQSIRFLQLSALELSHELAQSVLENPMLEAEPDYDIDHEPGVVEQAPDLTVDWSRSGRRHSAGNEGDAAQTASSETLQDYLLQQLAMTRAGSLDHVLVKVLVYELNQDGYLVTSVADVVAHLQRYVDVEEADVLSALSVLQSLEPAGVGARTLSECLGLQLGRLRNHDPDCIHESAAIACAQTVVSAHLELLASGNLVRLRQAVGCTETVLRAAHGLILSLDPRPARRWATNVADYVVPDVFVRRAGSRWSVVLNPQTVPKVRVHPLYGELVESSRDAGALREQLQAAQGLVRSLRHRCDTIMRVSQAIVDHQQDYLEHGIQAMRPLVLRDIANRLEIHESTVSRATRFKYAQTPHGVIELRAFFGSALDTAGGNVTSASAVQFLIARLIEDEPRGKPFSDNRIADHLETKGITIARRTVAKYREQAGIEPAIRRKARYSLGS